MNDGQPTMAVDALRAAMDEHLARMRQMRNSTAGGQPSENPMAGEGNRVGAGSGGGAGAGEGVHRAGGIVAVDNRSMGGSDVPLDWAKLPPRMARDLRASIRENNASEFRSEINAYFQAIAERAVR
ncbi:MAG: hypothetical protein CMO80_03915 [Verrucomicrobiales bacterium]|nr:hypothetical protein [Verrucomicrobiales bacterium]